ncbi:alpha-galactosidase [Candidatus Palauibacter sp.]|uniref:family 4 glycosyl hydrolase n=1 Tax=Candidatus Palauibacter sp. TaxID=3101350 RepID=UPI003B01C3D7
MTGTLKIVLVGAGSREFGPASIRDLLLSDPLCDHGLDIVLVDLDASELERTRAYADSVAERLGRSVSLSATTDLPDALPDADAVVMAIELRRYFYWAQDFHVPRTFGSSQIYGENGGPGGLFHALRNMGAAVDVARAMEMHCPEAWLLNYTNPLTKLCEAQTRLSSVRVVGLCHGVFHGTEQMARLLDLPPERLEARASGLNHFTWFESVRDRETGEDLYPRLREREREAHWLHDWDEIALSRILFRVFDRYPSPGANHIGEYLGWAREFLGSSLLQFFYDPVQGAPWETEETPTWIYNLGDHPTDVPLFPGSPLSRVRDGDEDGGDGEHGDASDRPLAPSGELAIPLLEGVLCDVDTRLDAVNVPNAGYVPGLPEDAVVEVPARASGSGLQPATMARLPEGILGLLRTQATINRLLVDAFSTGSRQTLLQAMLLDPTTHSYRAAVQTINEMFRLQGDVLPTLEW